MTPARANLDAVVGLANAPATKWSSLAAIVRFNLDGKIDARAGSTYRADVDVSYQANVTYQVHLEVDVQAHTYSVRVGKLSDDVLAELAIDYPFRTEQAGVTELDHAAAYVNPLHGGSMQVCGYTVVSTGSGDCSTTHAGAGFQNVPTTATTTVLPMIVTARASHANMDGVIGVANGPVDAFNDFAAAVRFGVSGNIEVRDLDTYRADVPLQYFPGQDYRFKFVIDIPSKTYSVFVLDWPEPSDAVQIARGYRFRTQQQNVTNLDHVATIVDTTFGSMDTCELHARPVPRMLAARDGTYDVHPLSNGGALIADDTSTRVLDANNAVVATIFEPGNVTTNQPGLLYTARILENHHQLRVTRYGYETVEGDSGPGYVRHYSTIAGSTVVDTVINNAGLQVVALAGPRPSIIVLDPSGFLSAVLGVPQNISAISLSPNNFATAAPIEGGYEIQVRRYDGSIVRSRQILGNFNIDQISIATDDTVVFAGHLGGPMDFGNCAIAPFSHDDIGTWDAYVTALGTDLQTSFCKRLTTDVTDIEHDTARIAVALHTRTQLFYIDTIVYDPTGNVTSSTNEEAFVGNWGRPGAIALSASGGLYLNVFVTFGGPVDERWPYLITLAP